MEGVIAILRLYEVCTSTDVLLELPEGGATAERAELEREQRGSDWAEFIPAAVVREELRSELCRAAHLLTTGQDVHRRHGEKLVAEVRQKAALCRIDVFGEDRN